VIAGEGVVAARDGSVALTDGSELPADAVVLALPPDRARQVAPAALTEDPGLDSSPLVNIHLWYDRPVMDGLFTAVVDSPAQWVFNRTRMGDLPGPGQHLAVSVSGAREEVERPKAELVESFAGELARLYPRAADARLERATVVKEPQATFAAAPGQAARRPGAATPVAAGPLPEIRSALPDLRSAPARIVTRRCRLSRRRPSSRIPPR